MFINVIKTYRDIVAVCDEELLGKTFEEENFQLDVKESFYKGDVVSEEEAIEILRDMALEDSTFNIVGEESINTALKAGIIHPESVGKIQGVPFAIILI